MVHFIGPNTKMQIQYFSIAFISNNLLHCVDILVDVFGGHFNNGCMQIGHFSLSVVLGEELGGVDCVVSEFFEAGQIHLIEHKE